MVWYYTILYNRCIDSILLHIAFYAFICGYSFFMRFRMQGDNLGCAEYIFYVSPLFAGVTDQWLSIIQVRLHFSLLHKSL